jgi:phosphoribosylamine--glycine ligase
MNILIVGSGGREHALAWKLAQEAKVFCCPGNPGIATIAECFPVSVLDFAGVIEVANQVDADLVVVGPEDPLIQGLADALREAGYAVFGPGRDAARLEGSKAWSKELMAAAGVPTAAFATFSDPDLACEFATDRFATGHRVVVKASGAALGKGVVVCETEIEAHEAIRWMIGGGLGSAGLEVVVEDRLGGREFSLLTLVSGTAYRSLPVAQDYKRIFEFDEGPNTGGMGSFSPVDWVSDDLVRRTEEQVVSPILRELYARGIDYRGVLFSGLMVEHDEPTCLEYNVRFGDPETESVMMRLGSGFADALRACAYGATEVPIFEVLHNAAVTVVLANEGYPGTPVTGRGISVSPIPSQVKVFHAGTKMVDGELVASGGRVLAVSASGETVAEARTHAYDGVASVRFEGAQWRPDIATTVG